MKPTLITLTCAALILGAATLAARIWKTPADALARNGDTTEVPTGRDDSPESALQVAQKLHSLHQDLAYTRIAELVRPDRREALLAFLMAVDDVIAANDHLRDTSQRVYGVPLPCDWNLGVMADNLGVFSSRVDFIGERVAGDKAEVTVQEGDNVPLVHLSFERLYGTWRDAPEPSPTSAVSEIRRLAEVIRDVGRSVEQGAPIESLADAFAYRIRPQMERVAQNEAMVAQTNAAD